MEPLLNSSKEIKSDNPNKDAVIALGIDRVLSRYLCGGSALRSSRGLPLKRLFLFKSGIPASDFQATQLIKEQSNYNRAVDFVRSVSILNIESIQEVNRIVCSSLRNKGCIRKTQNSVRNNSGKLIYRPPNPELLPELITKLEEDLTALNEYDSDESLRHIYVQIQQLHLFSDGNGRTGRAFYEGLLKRFAIADVNPMFYRLGQLQGKYYSFLKSYDFVERKTLHNEYWLNALAWCNDFLNYVVAQFFATSNTINSKIGMGYLNKEQSNLLNIIWTQPVLTPLYLTKHLRIDASAAVDVIKGLTELGVLEVQMVKSANHAKVFCSKEVLDFYDSLERKLFSREKD